MPEIIQTNPKIMVRFILDSAFAKPQVFKISGKNPEYYRGKAIKIK